jgi:hypothetical protein
MALLPQVRLLTTAVTADPPAARARQLSRLQLLFGPADQPSSAAAAAAVPECILAYGLAATGKT